MVSVKVNLRTAVLRASVISVVQLLNARPIQFFRLEIVNRGALEIAVSTEMGFHHVQVGLRTMRP